MATQLSLAREAMIRRPPAERDAEAKALSSPHFEIGWAETSQLRPSEADGPFLWTLSSRIRALEPSLADSALALGMERSVDAVDLEDDLKGALALPDGSFLVFRSAHSPNLARIGLWALLSTAMTILVGVAAVILMHRTATPLRELARVTGEIGHGHSVTIPETGPDETQHIARALNAMQERIHRLLAERTQALAAVSHDLRTPITRLRLRLDAVPDESERQAMTTDLDDMQSMIDSTLAYLRGEVDPEPPRITNVASVLLTIVDGASDAGWPVTYEGPSRALALVRPVFLKRAFENLVDNAVRYGTSARVALKVAADKVTIWVDDDGPGIAAEDVERAFSPFERLEVSRNRNTGGTGLGLTVARATILREGGAITLTNRPAGGLRVEVALPRTDGTLD